jgi:diguanylate cyclase (GGDEF)-like protein
MLDPLSLRVSLAVVAVTLMVLYAVTYRSTRSAFAAWWCASLALFMAGSCAYLLDGTAQQVWANPLGNVVLVAGVGCAWAGARSLRRLAMTWWWLLVAPVVVGLVSAVDDPAHNVWSGGPFFLGAMCVLLGLAALELGRLLREHRFTDTPDGRSHRLSVTALLLATSGLGVFYVGRWIAFLVVGPESAPFTTVFGEAATTLITTALLATVSFSMSTLSDAQQKEALRQLAARDGLTGLLNRTGFLRLAEDELRRTSHDGDLGQVILADLDHFKRINDEHGHLAGDRALTAFADACRSAIRSTDLAGRYGGEEFVILLVGAGPERAGDVTETIRAALVHQARVSGDVLPTASFGIAAVDASIPLEQAIQRADQALYRAKAQGRDRTVHHTPDSV